MSLILLELPNLEAAIPRAWSAKREYYFNIRNVPLPFTLPGSLSNSPDRSVVRNL